MESLFSTKFDFMPNQLTINRYIIFYICFKYISCTFVIKLFDKNIDKYKMYSSNFEFPRDNKG